METIKNLIVVGKTGAGKTTLVNGLRTPEYAGKVVIPPRYITRPQRQGDDLTENIHIDRDNFNVGVSIGLINPHWTRGFEGGREEAYGFKAVESDDIRLRVLSANDAILHDPNHSVWRALYRGMIVAAMASPEDCEERVTARSPDMSPEEKAMRLQNNSMDLLNVGAPIEIINTSSLTIEQGQQVLRDIVDGIRP
jgi:ribose 1,5-bisphosphokinase PhnN